MQVLEERKKKQKSQVEDIQDYLQERGKVEARYAKELERVAKEFCEKSHGPSLRWVSFNVVLSPKIPHYLHRTSSDLYLGLVDEAKSRAKQHDCLSRVFQTDLKDIRCKDIIGDMKRVYNRVNNS